MAPQKKLQTDPADIYAGAKLRNIRAIKNISQERLAEQIGVTFQQVQKYESGANRISVSRLTHICQVLEVPPSVFFHEDKAAKGGGLDLQPDELFIVSCIRKAEPHVRDAIKLLLKSSAHPNHGKTVETRSASQEELIHRAVLRQIGRIPNRPYFLTIQEANAIYRFYRDILNAGAPEWHFNNDNSQVWAQRPDGSWTRLNNDGRTLVVRPDGCIIEAAGLTTAAQEAVSG